MPRFVACKLLQNIRQTAFYLLSGLQSGLATLHSHFAKFHGFKSLISNYGFGLCWFLQSKKNEQPLTGCKNPSIYDIMRWFSGPMGQMTRQPSV